MPITERALRKIALSFPGATEEPSYGKPAFKIEKKFFTRLRAEDASIVWVVGSIDERDNLIEMDPKTYFITDHYKDYPSVLVRISRLNETMLRKMLERRWRAIAPKKLIKAVDEGAAAKPAPKKNATR
ncbi:MAG: MmcQ/YjbR family DNA-binding protein [Rhizomicrobium sp.]